MQRSSPTSAPGLRFSRSRTPAIHTGESGELTPQSQVRCRQFLNIMSPSQLETYYGRSASPQNKETVRNLIDFSFQISKAGPVRSEFERQMSAVHSGPSEVNADSRDSPDGDAPEEHLFPYSCAKLMMDMDHRIAQVFRCYGPFLPSSVWDCCSHRCFASLAINPEEISLLEEVLNIHKISDSLHKKVEDISLQVESRRRGVGGSNIAFVAPSRSERDSDIFTDRQKAIRQLAKFSAEVLPFLYGKEDAPSGTPRPKRKLCSEAIWCLLGVSRKFLYGRKHISAYDAHMTTTTTSGDEELFSIIDTTGVRLRQHRRIGSRAGYPEVEDLHQFNCGCSEPCLSGVPVWRLHCEYSEFSSLAKQLTPRRKEVRYLLNVMFCPLTNSSVNICNKSLSGLYTISEPVIADVRRVLTAMCSRPSLGDRLVLANGVDGYKKNPRHPMNRYSDDIRQKVETHLDFILRPDPGVSEGVNTCRVYSPEINTQEKLRKVLSKHLEEEEDVDVRLSSSTLQRMVNDYLEERKCRISFLQSDHNACPTCKTLQYALLQFNFEAKMLRAEREKLYKNRPLQRAPQERLDIVESDLAVKEYQEECVLDQAKQHNTRDAEIRGFLKKLSDFFRTVENVYISQEQRNVAPWDWRQRCGHALITHQDDMSKVDLPHFIVTASSDITRWRYDVNAHVSPVNGEAIVFSHEQGGGPKNASSIMELIMLDHLLRCRGEGIKIVVSDNAAVGKNWLTAVALPQYFVDQGLADVVLIVFLENNHGKWLSDMLFGQLQTRKKRSTIVGIDSLLTAFESINRKSGSVRGFGVNPLSCVDFFEVLSSLGYETTPPKEFGFLKRNIHFSAACAPGAKSRLPVAVQELMGDALPSEPGMVRICSDPPRNCPQKELPYEQRYVDVLAASHGSLEDDSLQNIQSGGRNAASRLPTSLFDAPLVVPMDKAFAAGGPGVVSYRNMNYVGFNGIEFRKLNSCPELRNVNDPHVMQAWPRGLITATLSAPESEPLPGSEFVKCAPENWIVRCPVARFNQGRQLTRARYPPRNMLNAKHKRPPRSAMTWVPTATYDEPPFAPIERTSAFAALQELQHSHGSPSSTVNLLDALRCVYGSMGGRENVTDPWLQHRVTRPSASAVQNYKKNLCQFQDREKGHPTAPKTIRNAFRSDSGVQGEIQRRLQGSERRSGESEGKAKTRIAGELFQEAELRPGGLEKYKHIVQKDIERYSRELKYFKGVTQKTFDEEAGLLPVTPANAPEATR